MHPGIFVSGIAVAVVGVVSLGTWGAYELFAPEPHRAEGVVAHAGSMGLEGSTYFKLAGSDEGYSCFVSYDDDCYLIKEGLMISMTYTTNLSGGHSVESIELSDNNPTTPFP